MSEEELIDMLYSKFCNENDDYDMRYTDIIYNSIEEKDKQLDKYKNVIDKIDKLINTDYGWVSYYYKYNNRYLKSEIKEDINKLLEEVE